MSGIVDKITGMAVTFVFPPKVNLESTNITRGLMKDRIGEQGCRPRKLASASIVIPTLNRHARLRSLLLKLAELDTLPQELIVVEQGAPQSLDELFSTLAEMGVRCRYICSSFVSAAFARNIGLILAEAPIIVYLDDDVEPLTDLVAIFTAILKEHPEATAGAGHVVCRHPVPQVAIDNTFQPTTEFVVFGLSSNVSFRSESLRSIGGFNPLIPCHGEETELFMRMKQARMKVINAQDSIVLHLIEQTGGTRETRFKSYTWYLDFIRSNATRIASVYSVLHLFPWVIKNLCFMHEAYCAGYRAPTRLKSLLVALLDGARLGRISRSSDRLALTSALIGSSISGPSSFLRSADRPIMITESRRISEIRNPEERLGYIRTLISIALEVPPNNAGA